MASALSCSRVALHKNLGRRRVVARARNDDQDALNFTPSRNAGVGYTEDDSAGQSNIFAVEPKTYVAGSKSDQTGASASSTLLVGAVAAIVAGCILIVGFATNKNNTLPYNVQYEEAGKHQTLSTLAQKFRESA